MNTNSILTNLSLRQSTTSYRNDQAKMSDINKEELICEIFGNLMYLWRTFDYFNLILHFTDNAYYYIRTV